MTRRCSPFQSMAVRESTVMLRCTQLDTVTCISLARLLLRPLQATQIRSEDWQKEVSNNNH